MLRRPVEPATHARRWRLSGPVTVVLLSRRSLNEGMVISVVISASALLNRMNSTRVRILRGSVLAARHSSPYRNRHVTVDTPDHPAQTHRPRTMRRIYISLGGIGIRPLFHFCSRGRL